MPNYSIEARSYSIPGLPASHDFWVLRNSDTGLEIAELHGLATDRATGEVVTIGTDDKLFSLNVWHFVHDTQYALELNVPVEDRTLIRQGQTSEIVFSGTFEEVLVRWNTAVNAIDLLNRLDLDYPAYGFKIFGDTINSNSAYRTLGEIMGITPYDFPGVVEPGFDNRMLPAEVVDSLKYKANGLSLVDWTNVFAAADDTGGLSTDLFTSIPNTIPGTILDTPDNPIQSVSSSGNLIQADATITVTGVTGYDVNAVSGNQQAANAIIGDDYRPGASEILYFDDWGVGSDAYSGADVGAYTNSQATGATQWTPVDPLVLDLNGDGVKLTSFGEAPVLFDVDHDGTASKEITGWASKEDGIVVMDLNGNGKIDGIHETMSEYFNGQVGTGGSAGTKPYANGFAALKSLDSNSDNQFTSSDAAWNNVKVWVDGGQVRNLL